MICRYKLLDLSVYHDVTSWRRNGERVIYDADERRITVSTTATKLVVKLNRELFDNQKVNYTCLPVRKDSIKEESNVVTINPLGM